MPRRRKSISHSQAASAGQVLKVEEHDDIDQSEAPAEQPEPLNEQSTIPSEQPVVLGNQTAVLGGQAAILADPNVDPSVEPLALKTEIFSSTSAEAASVKVLPAPDEQLPQTEASQPAPGTVVVLPSSTDGNIATQLHGYQLVIDTTQEATDSRQEVIVAKEEEEDADPKSRKLEALFEAAHSELQNMSSVSIPVKQEGGQGDNIRVIALPVQQSQQAPKQLVLVQPTQEILSTALRVVYPATSAPTSSITPPANITMAPSSVGRKRKHPQKPGKHICPYCSKGCTKPSVLQKHIRAHTGERPYPCRPCGISFKTKSNLYKHCKSRAHIMRAGIVATNEEAAAELLQQQSSVSSSRDDEDEDEEEEEEEQMEVELQSESPWRQERLTSAATATATSATTCSTLTGSNAINIAKAEQSTPTLFITNKQFYDVTYGNSSSASTPTILGSVISAAGHKASEPATVPQPLVILQPSTQQAIKNVRSPSGSAIYVRSASSTALTTTAAPVHKEESKDQEVTSTLEKYADKSMKVTIQLPPPSAAAVATSTITASSLTSAATASLGSSVLTTDPPELTPEKVGERIQWLISNNAAIVDMPMADAPRPKRVSRQNSEPVQSLTRVLTPSAGVGSLPRQQMSVDGELPVPKPQQHFLELAEPSDQPPGSLSLQGALAPTSSSVVAAPAAAKPDSSQGSASSAVDEITIQFKLPKPGSGGPSSVMIGQPPVQFPSTQSVILTPDGQQWRQLLNSTTPQPSAAKELLVKNVTLPQEKEGTIIVGKLDSGATSAPNNSESQIFLVKDDADGDGSDAASAQTVQCFVELGASMQPKRGRPKGSKNRPKTPVAQTTGVSPRVLLPREQAPLKLHIPQQEKPSFASPSMPSSVAMPVPQTPATAVPSKTDMGTQQPASGPVDWKLKLKGRLLMKRSMSVERMLSQEKEWERSAAARGHAPSALNILRRAESLDETVQPGKKRRRLQHQPYSIDASRGDPEAEAAVRHLGRERSQQQLEEEQQQQHLEPQEDDMRGEAIIITNEENGQVIVLQDGHAVIEASSEPPAAASSLKALITQPPSSKDIEDIVTLLAQTCTLPVNTGLAAFRAGCPRQAPMLALELGGQTTARLPLACIMQSGSEKMLSMLQLLDTAASTTVETMATQPSKAVATVSAADTLTECSPGEKICEESVANTRDVKIADDDNDDSFVAGLEDSRIASHSDNTVPCDALQISPVISDRLVMEIDGKEMSADDLTGKESLTEKEKVAIDEQIDDEKTTNDGKMHGEKTTEHEELDANEKTDDEAMDDDEKAKDEMVDNEATVNHGKTNRARLLSDSEKMVAVKYDKLTVTAPEAMKDKVVAALLLLGHSCTSLQSNCHLSFCSLMKPQPMYVRQGSNRSISMYSNWRTATFNPNPMQLTSKQMLDLYETSRGHSIEPRYNSATCEDSNKTGLITHSTYWTYRGQGKQRQATDVRMTVFPEIMTVMQGDAGSQPQPYNPAAPKGQSRELSISAKKQAGSGGSSTEPQKIHIFPGGYKSNEDYAYVRGRGRGKYVCEECGIRCKKPSMLKKHIRTHTDLRPYHCLQCNFSFKTKGNLTKHMKSKTHHRKCLQLGVTPVPVSVDERHVDASTLEQQHSVPAQPLSQQPAMDLVTYTVDGVQVQQYVEEVVEVGDEEEEEQVEYEEVEDDEEEEEEEVQEVEEEEVTTEGMMILSDLPDNNVSAGSASVSEAEPQYIALQREGTTEPSIVPLAVLPSLERAEQPCKQDGKGPLHSIDKEIAAASLLDLSKAGHKQSAEDTDAEQEQKGFGRLNILIGALRSRTKSAVSQSATDGKVQMSSPAVTLAQMDAIPKVIAFPAVTVSDNKSGEVTQVTGSGFVPPPLLFGGLNTPTLVPLHSSLMMAAKQDSLAAKVKIQGSATLGFEHHRGITPEFKAQETAASEIKGEKLEVLEVKLSGGAVSKFRGEASASLEVKEEKTALSTVAEQESTVSEVRSQGSVAAGVKGQNLTAAEEKSEGTSLEGVKGQESSKSSEVFQCPVQLIQLPGSSEPITIPNLTGLHGMPAVVPSQIPVGVRLVSAPLTSDRSGVRFVTGQSCAPYEIVPIPGKVNDNPDDYVNGKYLCNVCQKAFSKQHQLTIHKNIHFFERPWKCEDCNTSFRSKGVLEKHLRSEGHMSKQNIQAHVTVVSSDNPRRYKCLDCNIGFRIHGHLAKHLRSKAHVMSLEKYSRVPPGTYAQMERAQMKGADAEPSMDDIQQLIESRSRTVTVQAAEASDSIDPNTWGVLSDSSISDRSEPEGLSYSAALDDIGSPTDPDTLSDPNESDVTTSSREQRVTVSEEFEHSHSASNARVAVEIKAPSQLAGIQQCSKTLDDVAGVVLPTSHTCGICSQNFEQLSALKQHLVTHAELRPYVCEYCDAGFTREQSLNTHLRTHRQERPYVCGQCGETFANSNNLHQHLNECTTRLGTPLVTMAACTTATISGAQQKLSIGVPEIVASSVGLQQQTGSETDSGSGGRILPPVGEVSSASTIESESLEMVEADDNRVEMQKMVEVGEDGSPKNVEMLILHGDSDRVTQ